MEIEKKLLELGITLPKAMEPLARYKTSVTVGNLMFTSGSGCFVDGELAYEGRLGETLTVEDGYEASRITAINILSLLKSELGSLNRVKRIVKMLAFVNSTDDFYNQPEVVNGASDLFVEVFGEGGLQARSAIGTNVLPMNLPVEIELIVEIEN